MARVSVIIPVYNMEGTIGETIASVLQQTYTDFELVIIDDGSTDSTVRICDEAKEADRRVRVVHQANGGVSRARNAGLAAAKGEYIAWLDGDDQMCPDALRRLMDAIDETGADMSLCNYENVTVSDVRKVRYDRAVNEVIDSREALRRILCRDITQSLCFNLAPRAFYRDIVFPEGEWFEDVRNSYKLYAQSKKIAVVNDTKLYARLVREDSISHVKSIQRRAQSCEAYLIRQRELNAIWQESEAIFVRENHASLLLELRRAVLREDSAHFDAEKKRIHEICGYFRAKKRLALGERPSIPRRAEYFLLTRATRPAFFLSRLITLPARGGTWLR